MIVLSRYSCNALNAGPKAKVDIENILNKEFHANVKTYKHDEKNAESKFEKIKRAMFTLKNIKKNEMTIIQFPYSNVLFITKKAKKKVAFIHDLDGLRINDKVTEKKELDFLKTCKYVIAHNQKMKQYLIENNIDESKIYVLELFDYLCKKDEKEKNNNEKNYKVIAYAGNLLSNKSPFIYQLESQNMNFELALYGKGISGEFNEKISYKGAFPPEQLPNVIREDLGLIWDGNYDESDENETFKNYTKYNNPHKLSCYIAAEIPVIVWEKSAIADLVNKYDIGYTISNIYDINKIDFSNYETKKENIKKLGEKVRVGYFTQRVIKEILDEDKKAHRK